MIWQLMKRDPAWRWVLYLTLGSGAFCLLWQWKAPRAAGVQDLIANIILVGAFSVLAYAAGFALAAQQDDTGFQSALPVTVRQIYLARTLSLIAMLWIPVLAGAAVVLATDWTQWSPVSMLVNVASVFSLAATGLQSAIIRRYRIPRDLIRASFILWAAGIAVAPLTSALPEGRLLWILMPLFCWLCIAAIILSTWRKAPLSFRSAPLQASARVAGSSGASKAQALTNPWLSVWRSLFRGGAFWVIYCFGAIALFGSMQVAIILSAALWPNVRLRIRWLLARPLPAAGFLLAILLPYFLAFAAGYLVNVHIPGYSNTLERAITIRASQEGFFRSWPAEVPNCRTLNIIPAVEFWVPAVAEKAPMIRAPWGETFQPPTAQRYGFDVFNPYAVGCANTERFFNWQFSRATRAVYGRSIPFRKYPTGDTVNFPLVITGIRQQFVNVAVIAGYLILGTLVMLIGDWYRFRRLAQPARVALYVVAGAIGLAVFVGVGTQRLDIVQWLSWTLPSSLSGTIAVAMPVLAALCWVTYGLFRQLELVDKPGNPSVQL